MYRINLYALKLIEVSPGYAWPLVALIAVLVFRKDISVLIKRIVSFAADWKGGRLHVALDYPKRVKDENTPKLIATTSITKLDAEKAPNIFWAGHDLMFTMDALLRGDVGVINFGLAQSLHHIKEADLGEPSVQQVLQKLLDETITMQDHDWDVETRERVFVEVRGVRDALQQYLRQAYPTYSSRASIG